LTISPSNSIAAVFLLLTVSTPVLGQEKKIDRSELPPAVEKVVAALSQGATIRGFSQEKENGRILYEIELMVAGRTKDVLMDGEGSVVEVEEEVAVESLPPAVRTALQAESEKGKLLKVETLTKGGKLVAYEAHLLTNGKKSEVQVGPDGKRLDHEE